MVTDADEVKIKQAFEILSAKQDLLFPDLYGDGKASEFICRELIDNLSA